MVCLFNPLLIFVKRIIFSLLSDLHVQYHIFFQRRLFGRSSDSVWPRKLLLSLARHRPPSPPQPASAPQQAPHPPTHHPKCTIGLANLPLGLSGRTLKFRFLRLHGPNFYGPLKHHRNSPGFSGTVAVPWGWWHMEAGLQLDESFRVTHIPSLA